MGDSNRLAKRNRREHYTSLEGEDRISRLPEDILGTIVCLLPLKQALATSTLSRRWRYVWTCAKNLNFESMERCSEAPERRYVECVDSVVNQHVDQNVDRFSFCFDVGYESQSSINNWIKFAMRNRVQVLELESLRDSVFPQYVLDQQLLAHKEVEVGFTSLKELSLVNVMVDGEAIDYLLSKCPLLERLQVIRSLALLDLRVVGRPLLALKHLKIQLCFLLQRVEIVDAENLVSFTWCYSQVAPMALFVRNVPVLVDVNIKIRADEGYRYVYNHVFPVLACCLSRLKILHLDVSVEDYEENPVHPTLANLEELNLKLDPCDRFMLARLIPFMKKSPRLRKLVLKIAWHNYELEEEEEGFIKPAKCPHGQLKELEVFGYGGRPNHDELIIYLIENAVSLGKVTVTPCVFKELTHRSARHIEHPIEKFDAARCHAIQHLKEKVPSTIDFNVPLINA